MDFRMGEKSDEFAKEVADFLDEHLTEEVVMEAHETGTVHNWGFYKAMADAGYTRAAWPKEFGGQERDPFEMAALSDQLNLRHAPTDGSSVTLMICSTLRHVGTPEQQADIIPRGLNGEILICLGYSEPDSGSDAAAAATRADRDGDEWVINGQKMFTTLAHEADYVFMLTRTNHDVPKHKGLTMFLVPMDAEGIEIQPVHTMGGERTNITFYNDVKVPDALRVGDVDAGWGVMRVALTFERGGSMMGQSVRLVRLVEEWAKENLAPNGRPWIEDPLVRERLARANMLNNAGALLGLRSADLFNRGELPGVEGSMSKLFSSEKFLAICEDLVDMLGPEGVLQHGEDDAPSAGWVEHAMRHAVVTTIYGGTSEIQRGIIAEHGLGLPRTRKSDRARNS
ncbi:MAG: acyl-CoA dehydrogenase family protein [Ilumatobacteraceae bacterium]|nr:acyl-CoA dehydrogenase family protein [Ilumatobacteraceae bacterium]